MTALLVSIFVASLIGSLHCAGMCGGVVALCVGGQPVRARQSWAAPVMYNLGRLVTYATLGAVSGSIGRAIDLGGSSLGLTRLAAPVAGATMILIGVLALLRLRGTRFSAMTLPSSVQSTLGRMMRGVQKRPPMIRSAVLGLLTGFLPCGWLYAFVITSAGTGHPLLGALAMTVFWAGTVPVLFGIGVGAQMLSQTLRQYVPTITAIALVAVGLFAVFGRLSVPAYADTLDARAQRAHGDGKHVHVASDSTDMPCCNDDE